MMNKEFDDDYDVLSCHNLIILKIDKIMIHSDYYILLKTNFISVNEKKKLRKLTQERLLLDV